MGMQNVLYFFGIYIGVILVGCYTGAGSETPVMDNSGFLLGNLFGDRGIDFLPGDPLQGTETSRALLTGTIFKNLKIGSEVTSLGTGWKDITMPALISEPGNYRVVNDYTASGVAIGLAINSSDVHIDGAGHIFRGDPESECYGIAATSDMPILNISISNFHTKSVSGGIVLIGVQGGEISETHHTDTPVGISLGSSQFVSIIHNTVNGYQVGNSDQDTMGIVVMNGTNVSIESNDISNITPSAPDVHAKGISLIESSNSKILNNTISGSTTGVIISASESVNISHNVVSAQKMAENGGEIFGITAISTTDISIGSNQISNIKPVTPYTRSVAVSLVNCIRAKVLGNEIAGMTDFGIISSSDGLEQVQISDNAIISPQYYGIYVNDGSGIISNNDVGGGVNGVLVAMDNSVISMNRIHDSLQKGLEILGANLTLSQNILTNNTYNFYMDGNRAEHYLHHIDRTNLINGRPLVYIRERSGEQIGPADNPAMVIVVSSDTITIHDIVTGSNMAGIVLADVTNATISNVTDIGSLAGIGASRSKGCIISDVSVSKSYAYGFALIEDADFSLYRCDVSETSGIGYLLRESDNLVLNECDITNFSNDILEGSVCGVLIDGSRSVLIQNSSITNSPDSGIVVSHTEGLIVSNSSITGNDVYGIAGKKSAHISVNHTIIAGNHVSGIAFNTLSTFCLNRNSISGNNQSGIALSDAYEGLVTDNYFNNTKNIDYSGNYTAARWNTTLTAGRNIIGGPSLGGNFWADPDGRGFSQTHEDRGDGICNSSYVIHDENIDHLPLAVLSEDIVPNFLAEPRSGTPPLTVQFVDRSTGFPVQWNWTFGDGTTAHEQNPIHTYTGIGRYTVTLEITGQNRKQGILRLPSYINIDSGRVTGPNGMIRVDSTPQNASVFVDDIYLGHTPLQASGISAGIHQIMLVHEGYQSWSGTVMVRADQCTYVPRVLLQREGEGLLRSP